MSESRARLAGAMMAMAAAIEARRRGATSVVIDTLELPAPEKARLKALTPAGYTGKAAELARRA